MNFSSSKASLCETTQWKIGLDIVAIIANDKEKKKSDVENVLPKKGKYHSIFIDGFLLLVIFQNSSLTSSQHVNFNSI